MSRNDKAIVAVERALRRLTEHLSGDRDPSLPGYIDTQLYRFQDILQNMKASLEPPFGERVLQKRMGYAIADGWPIESELGELICEAEALYNLDFK